MTTTDFYKQQLWTDILKAINESGQIGQDVFDMYFTSSKLYEIGDNKFTVLVPTFIAYACLKDNIKTIENCFEAVFGSYKKIEIIQEQELAENPIYNPQNPINEFGRELDPEYTFANFVVGKSNIQAQVAALTVATNPGTIYNPLFIYGNSGLGKTHLLHSIGHQVKANNPKAKICCIQGLDFVEGVAKYSKEKRLDEFKSFFRDLDLLLVDDIQFIAGKEKTHEIFFSVFNDLVNNHKHVCLTADRLPKDIQGLEDRIISRFNQGLNINIEAPEFETRLNIVKNTILKSSINTLNVDDDVISYIATNFSSDVRTLKGAVARLLFYAVNWGDQVDNIDIKIASEAFKGQIIENSNDLDIKKIRKIVCDYYNLTTAQIISKTRTANIANARHIAMYLCRKLLDSPFQEIGLAFGNRDHSTVMSACEKVEQSLKSNTLYMKAINEIEERLK